MQDKPALPKLNVVAVFDCEADGKPLKAGERATIDAQTACNLAHTGAVNILRPKTTTD